MFVHHNNTEKYPYCYFIKDKDTNKYKLDDVYETKIDIKVITHVLYLINNIDKI